ncbi:hypothetical protein OUZ56_012580 [Daphnia magna]|uniref:Uncharacterized protein n=1 Tax=Daphnia magna TaxID=35525 RepID=A0ABQ9Z3F5_9CRUS|nr:hypothetical protein OUZ56_012580 [Daphnia magna]
MAENPHPSGASVKEKIKKSREMEENCTNNLRERQRELSTARQVTMDAVYTHEVVVKRLNEEMHKVAVDLANVHVHYHAEREILMSGFIGSLIRKRMDASTDVDASLLPLVNPSMYLDSDSGEPPQVEGMDASTQVSVSPLSMIEIGSTSA